eukprot:jgi/Chlat1/6071/Chrsp4S09090
MGAAAAATAMEGGGMITAEGLSMGPLSAALVRVQAQAKSGPVGGDGMVGGNTAEVVARDGCVVRCMTDAALTLPRLARCLLGAATYQLATLMLLCRSLLAASATAVANRANNPSAHVAKDPKHLLPPLPEKHADRLTVVLDLDETLVCAYNCTGAASHAQNLAAMRGMRCFNLTCNAVTTPEADAIEQQQQSGAPQLRRTTGSNAIIVYERPGLETFLKRLSDFADLVLFTAGLEGYAHPLINRIDPEGTIKYRLYRNATVSTSYRDHVKDLSKLGRDLRRTVLVDNNPFSFLLQPGNGIPCVSFTGDPSDRELENTLLPLLEQLAEEKDVRPMLVDRFKMPEWFRMRGIPAKDTCD